jgi:hypothetical protein
MNLGQTTVELLITGLVDPYEALDKDWWRALLFYNAKIAVEWEIAELEKKLGERGFLCILEARQRASSVIP